MKVSIKEFNVGMEVKTGGIEFQVKSPDGDTHHGDLILTKAKLIWCRGRTPRSSGTEISWRDFIEYMESRG